MRIKLLIVLVILILILIILVFDRSFYPKEFVTERTVEKSEDLFFIHETIRYPAIAQIIEPENNISDIKIGVTAETRHLNFGVMPIGLQQIKYFDVENNKDVDMKVKIISYGNISPMISFDKNNFIIQENETSKIAIHLDTSKITKIGNYTGEVDLSVIKPKNKFLEYFLR